MSSSNQSVFLTGASGFVASHILAGLLERGYSVTASVRSEAKAQQILALHHSRKSQLSFAYVADIAVHGAFEAVFTKADQTFDYIIHTASPVSFEVTDFQKELIDPAVLGSIGLLKSAHELGGSGLKRFVLLSSAVACLDSFQDLSVAGKDYTETDWNPLIASQAIESGNPVLVYNASKKLAEQAAWRFMEENKPVFDLTVINPDIIIGPILQPLPGPDSVNNTNEFAMYNFLNGVYKQIDGLTFPFYHFVDVRDVARAHITSMTNEKASGQRILLISGLITPQLVINIIRKRFPELRDRVMEGEPSRILPKGVDPTGWDASRSTEILGGKDWSYIGLEQSVVDTVSNLLALESKWKA